MRLDKFLADVGMGTRSEVKRLIHQGAVAVNGSGRISPKQQIDPKHDVVCCFGTKLHYQKYVYYMFYKPKGCVTARKDKTHKTVMDYIDVGRTDLFPAGRLDLDTEGLLLITNDGTLAHNLLSPAKHVRKTYLAKVDGCVGAKEAEAFANGLDIGDDTPAKPAKLVILSSGEASDVEVTITEGRYHQVKRMFHAVGREVLALKRTAIGDVTLDAALSPGEFRELTKEEEAALKRQEDRNAGADKSSNF